MYNVWNTMNEKEVIFKKKTEILCKGIYLDEKLIKHYKNQGINLDFGRSGGAGPLGGRYFIFEDDVTLVNAALWNDREKTDLILKERVNGYFEVYDDKRNELFCKLKLIEFPKFYDLKTSDGILMKKIALMHGVDCLGTTIYQKCKYWGCGEACKFCGIELSLDHGTTILEKNHKQISEVITAAKNESKCSHVTLTSGTTEEDHHGVNRYIEILRNVKKKHLDVSLHVQIEPFKDLSKILELKKAGADTIGIHLEILDEKLRKEMMPGKYKTPLNLYKLNWKQAIETFGKNQVETYILMGLGESLDEFMNDLEKIISLGVIPYITPVRSIPNTKSTLPGIDTQTLIDIYLKAAKLMKKHDVNPLENIAGCVRCGGCSAIAEAYKALD
jgi:radical SAM protein (TIGR04043 family)